MKQIIRYICAVVVYTMALSCQVPETGPSNVMHKFRITSIGADSTITRSVLEASPDAIKNLCAFAFNTETGDIIRYRRPAGDKPAGSPAAIYIEDESSFEWALPLGVDMDIYIVCNMGQIETPENLADFLQSSGLEYEINDVSELNTSGIPMTAVLKGVNSSSESEIHSLTARRLVARYTLKVSDMPAGYEITGIRICNVNARTSLFSENEAAGESSTLIMGDWATDEDLSELNSGGRAEFFMFENAQTTTGGISLPPGIRWHEVHETLGDQVQFCTYLDILSEYNGNERKDRLYLGKDCVSDFDVIRNTIRHITCPAAYTVTNGAGQDAMEFTESIKIKPGQTVYVPFAYNLSLSETPPADIVFTADDALTPGVPEFTSEGDCYGTGRIPVTCSSSASDGDVFSITMRGGDASASTSITVYTPAVISYYLKVTPEEVTVPLGQGSQLNAVFYTLMNGNIYSGTDVTTNMTWTSDNPLIAGISSSGYVSGIAEGSTYVTGAYRGYNAYIDVDVIDNNEYTYSLEVSNSSVSIEEGGSTSITATYKSYTNGVLTGSYDVTSVAGWSSSDQSTASVSKGKITGVSEGAAVITATYEGLSADCDVSVSSKKVSYTYELLVTPSTLTVQEGNSASLTAEYLTYADEVLESSVNVTSAATWKSSSAAATVNKGTVIGNYAGTALITATYNNCSATSEINVLPEDKVLSGITISPSQSSYDALDHACFTATAEFDDGTSEDVTSSATWTCSGDCKETNVSGEYLVGTADWSGKFRVTCSYTFEGETCTSSKTCNVVYEKDGMMVSSSTAGWQSGNLTLNIEDPYGKGWRITSDDDHFTISGGSSGKGSCSRTLSYDTIYSGGTYHVYVTVGNTTYSAAITRAKAPTSTVSVDYYCYATLTATGNTSGDSGPGTLSVYFKLSEPALQNMTVYDNHGNAYAIAKGSSTSGTKNLSFDYMPYDDIVPDFIKGESISPASVTLYDESDGITTYTYVFDY